MEVQEIQEGPGEFGKTRGVHCFCIANSKACLVFISLSPAAFLPYFSRPELLTPPRPTAGGHDRFPMLTFSMGQVFVSPPTWDSIRRTRQGRPTGDDIL